jgi:hypothetical protein
MDREKYPARHPGCKMGAPKVIPIFLHYGNRGLCAHYCCPACRGRGRSGQAGRWSAQVTPVPLSDEEAAA